MKLNIKVKMNDANKIIREHGLGSDGNVTNFLRNEVDRFCDPYIPMQTGTLKNTKTYPNCHTIQYTSPYARYQYYGKSHAGQPLHYSGAPKRGDHWDKRMMNDHKQEIVKNVQKFIKSGEGSKNNGISRNVHDVVSTTQKMIRIAKNPSSLLSKYKISKPKFIREVDKYSKKIENFSKK